MMDTELANEIPRAVVDLERVELSVLEIVLGDSYIDIFEKTMPRVVELGRRIANERIVEHLDREFLAVELHDIWFLRQRREQVQASTILDCTHCVHV